LRERGAVLITHSGLSGPAILRLSAWGARELHALNYDFPLRLNWVADLDQQGLAERLDSIRGGQAARLVVNAPLAPLAARLWQSLVLAAGITRETRWAELSRSGRQALIQQLTRTEFQVTGKSLNQEEFVTCGGVRLSEVNFKTMESRVCPALYLGGELLDVDGLTGGFNFQSAWTTGWIAGKAISGSSTNTQVADLRRKTAQ
jgi:predicted Rossmann fold flavoprotein